MRRDVRSSAVVELSRGMASELFRSNRAVVAMLVSFGCLLAVSALVDHLVGKATGVRSTVLDDNLAVLLVVGLATVAVSGTALSLATMRHRGTLRLLATTPVPRAAILGSQVPVRAGVAFVETAVVVALAATRGLLTPAELPALLGVVGGGFAMLLGLGLLLGARMRDPDLALQVGGVVPVVVLFTAGSVIPTDSVPRALSLAIDALPTTWFVRSLDSLLTGSPPVLPLPVAAGVLILAGALLVALGVRFFDWGREPVRR
ncbi:ABC transporter permease [Cellulosimicrobium marinum]|uniref:ABC transporter permease n=1 Tax=Cellulosimicrobium marinum TaxID=1638992 RepID=UPI001E2AB679|nr:ABC transporter permease [Cellulosimicrobium marinum]MCB7136948.1 ABC transporter permease [Cellulosimicrobium marinum]